MDEKCENQTTKTCCCTGSASTAPSYPGLDDAARLFKALSDETRLAILKQLRERGEVCACDFVACCEVAQPTVSHHLSILRKAGLVRARKDGLWVHYSLNEERLAEARQLVP